MLTETVDKLHKIGQKGAEALLRLNIRTIFDLLLHLPSSVSQKKFLPHLSLVSDGDYVILKLKLLGYANNQNKYSRARPSKVMCAASGGLVDLVYFNYYPHNVFLHFIPGDHIVVSGKIARYRDNLYQIIHPDQVVHEAQIDETNKLHVTYPLTYGVVSKQLHNYVNMALKFTKSVPEWIEQKLLIKKNWKSLSDSLNCVHNNLESTKAKERLIFDELLANQLAIRIARKNKFNIDGRGFKNLNGVLVSQLKERLDFELTEGQKNVISEIIRAQEENKPMRRLLQGDVGCGKTIVALISMVNLCEVGPHQSCLMAPTDLLANQHYQTISKLLEGMNIDVACLTGKTKGKARHKILEDLKNGEIDILIGTHALFQEEIRFKDLALIVIDEQHRFGVRQRLSMLNKGNMADMLVMSATPIPRTLCLTLYGDMDISKITEKPSERLPVDTTSMSVSKLMEVVHSLEKKIDRNEKIYWICPLIEVGGELVDQSVMAVEERFNDLSKVYPGKVALVHGKMKSDQKEQALLDFAFGDKMILVATTVIEVGINVPEATLIVIENAEKFGLAQLHQLRGRVGRSDKKSHCILIYSNKISNSGVSRLSALKRSNDGFFLAEEDLKIRGSGEFMGEKQSGVPEFRVADFYENRDLLIEASHYAKKIIEDDPLLVLPENQKYRFLLKLFLYHDTDLLRT